MISTLLNKRNQNGSINLLTVTGDESGAVVSPFHPEFRSQIEDGIWPIVSALIDKGFIVVDSCEGHFDGKNNDHSHFTVAFSNLHNLEKFRSLLQTPGVVLSVHNTWLVEKNETEFINQIYFLSNSSYTFLSVNILPGNYLGSKILKLLFSNLLRKVLLNKIIKLPRYEHLN